MPPIGHHILLEHWGGKGLTDQVFLDTTLRAAASAAGATCLSSHFHPFEGGGVTGVVLLAESHITIHTWPEHDYAALDIFMCGSADPTLAVAHLNAALCPTTVQATNVARGNRNP